MPNARRAISEALRYTNLKEDEMGTAEQGVISTVEQDADRQLKAKHRALWASGNYPAVAAELIPALGPELVQACGVGREIASWTLPRARATRLFRPLPWAESSPQAT